MKLRIEAHIIDNIGKFYPGDEKDIPDDVAKDWIERGLALRIEEPEKKAEEGDDEKKSKDKIETATLTAPEHATGRRQREPAPK